MDKYIMKTATPEETRKIGEIIGKKAEPGDTVLFTGDLGAGKTTMSQGIVKGAGSDDVVNSPTFVIVQEYAGVLPIYHIDAYRLENEREGTDIGMEEFIGGDGLALIEWSEKLDRLLPEDALLVDIRRLDAENEREITLSSKGKYGRKYFEEIIKELKEQI